MTAKTMTAMLAALALIGGVSVAQAGTDMETDMEKALAGGAERLTADQIAERFAGKTVTFVSAAGDKRFHIYYDEGNRITGEIVGGDWTDTGFYGIADDDQICYSWENSDKPRLRCMSVLVVEGVVQKFKPDGRLQGSAVEIEDGKLF